MIYARTAGLRQTYGCRRESRDRKGHSRTVPFDLCLALPAMARIRAATKTFRAAPDAAAAVCGRYAPLDARAATRTALRTMAYGVRRWERDYSSSSATPTTFSSAPARSAC